MDVKDMKDNLDKYFANVSDSEFEEALKEAGFDYYRIIGKLEDRITTAKNIINCGLTRHTEDDKYRDFLLDALEALGGVIVVRKKK